VSDGLPRRVNARLILPTGVARRIVVRACQEWGHEAESEIDRHRTQVSFFLGGRSLARSASGRRPAGGFIVRWGAPRPSESMIEQIGWDPYQGGSEDEVRHVIDTLAGYPLATRAEVATA
jgi:hypothetical protein